jgi:hypothetical protein
LARVAVALLAVLAVGGCGGGDDKQSSKTSESTAKQSTSTTPSGKPVAVPAKAIAPARQGPIDGNPVQLEIVELKRGGSTMTLTFRLTGEEGQGGSQVASTFDDGIFQKLKSTEDPTAGADSLDGITLIDTKNRKRYLVGRDEDGACVCDTDLGNAFANADAPLLLSATYAAPPPDVRAMDVLVPHFGAFKDVPVS